MHFFNIFVLLIGFSDSGAMYVVHFPPHIPLITSDILSVCPTPHLDVHEFYDTGQLFRIWQHLPRRSMGYTKV